MIIRFLSAVFILGLALISSSLAQAQGNEEARLKAIFTKMLEGQKTATAASGDEFITEGEIQIEDAGNYYAVTLPNARLKTASGNVIDIGMIAVNASSQPAAANGAGQWKMTIALPTPFAVKDALGQPLMTLSIGGQKVSGIWNETLEAFTTLDAQYTGLKLEDAAQQVGGSLAALHFSSSLQETKPGKWSGPVHVKLEGLEVNLPVQRMKISLKSGSAQMDMLDYDLAAIKAARTSITSAASPLQAVLDLLTKNGEGLKMLLNLQQFEVIAPQPEQEAMGKFSIATGALSVGFSGFTQDKVTAKIGLDYRGLDPRPLSAHLQNLVPREAHLDWELKNLPLQKLSATVQNTLAGTAANAASPAMQQIGMMSLLTKLPALLSEAQTSLTVEKNYITNDIYRAELEGGVKSDLTAYTGFISDFMLGVYGLDNLIVALENAANVPTTMYRSELRGWASNLKYFKGFALQKKDDQGTAMHSYHFQITPQGQFLLNDKDAAALLNGTILPPVPAAPSSPAAAQ